MISTGLTMVAGAYCAGTYYAHRSFAKDAFDSKRGWGWRTYAAGMFIFAPITAPIQLVVLLIVY